MFPFSATDVFITFELVKNIWWPRSSPVMSKKPSRIKPEVENLSPASEIKVFSFINTLLEQHRLDTKFFKEELNNFNAGEQYIICKYCNLYFRNKGNQIYLCRWLEDQFEAYDDIGEPEAYDILDEEVTRNQLKLLNILPFYQNIALKRFRDLIRFNIPINKYLDFHKDDVIDCRIPLVYGKTEFKKQFFNIWRELYTEQQVEDFYRNSFRFTNNDPNPSLLYLDIDKRGWVDQQMFLTIDLYRNTINRQTQKKANDYNNALKAMSKLKKVYYKEYDYESIIRDSFVKIMFNAFPEVRDKYKIKLLKVPNYSKTLYFENIIKNFSINRK